MAKVNRKTEEEQAADQLALSPDDLYRVILSSVEDGISVQDRDLKILFVNEAHRRMFGDDIIGKYCYNIYERREKICPSCPVVGAFETGKTVRDIHQGFDQDNNPVTAEISASPIHDAEGNIVAAVEVVRDISAQYSSQQELDEKTRRLERMAAVSREIVSGRDLKTILENVVERAVELTGAEAGTIALLDPQRQVISYPYYFNMPEEMSALEVSADEGLAGYIIRTGETVLLDEYSSHSAHLEVIEKMGVGSVLGVPMMIGDRGLGAIGLIHKTPGRIFDEEDKETAMVIANQAAVAIDNAQLLQKTQQGLRIQQELNKVAASISSGLDLDQVLEQVVRYAAEVVAADAAMVALLEEENDLVRFPVSFNLPAHLKKVTASRDQGLAASVIACSKPSIVNDYQSFESRNESFAEAGVRAVVTVPLTISDRCVGAIGVMDMGSGRQFVSGDIEILSTISRQAAVAVDNAYLYEEISRSAQQLEERVKERTEELERMYKESKLKSKELEEANLRLKEVDQLKSEFLANMSHELRTPLNSIIGFSKLMLDGLDGGLNTEQKRDLEIVHSSGHSLIRLIDDLLSLAKIEAGRVALDINEEDPVKLVEEAVIASRPRVEKKQLVLEFDAPEGLRNINVDSIRIRQVLRYLIDNAIKFTEEGTIRVIIEQSPEETDFAVADTGIGLDAEQIDVVFERFHQVSPGLAEKGGMGLGLAISKRLVEMHHGTIRAESRPGKGSVFSFTIPG